MQPPAAIITCYLIEYAEHGSTDRLYFIPIKIAEQAKLLIQAAGISRGSRTKGQIHIIFNTTIETVLTP